MRIVVCVKQVPELDTIQVDPVKGTLVREGVQSILNPFCEYALDQAVRLRKALGSAEIFALTMGPAQAKTALTRCLELGADEGILVTDLKFAGSDTWATALTLAKAISVTVPDFDLILTGKQAIDGDTAQVGPELAEILGLPQIAYGVDVCPGNANNKIQVTQEVEQGYEIGEVRLPALVTCSKGEIARRAPSLTDVLNARGKPIRIVSAMDLPIPAEDLGLNGSYTQVIKVFAPRQKQSGQKFETSNPEEAALIIFDFLRNWKFID